jgi:type II secretory pathway component GspD/PulD (secretin)
VYTAVRQLLPPEMKSFFVPSQMAIEVCGSPENLSLAERIITDLDRSKKAYRITYTVTEMDGTRRVSSQHFSLIVAAGQNSTLKLGSRVPIVTGSFTDKSSTQQNTVSYVDVGINFDAALDETAEGIRLRTSAEQSSIAEEKSGVGPQDPVVRQASFKGTSYLAAGKPVKLGTFDIADTTRRLELEVVMEPLP